MSRIMELLNTVPRKTLLRTAVAVVIVSGFLFCSWSGGVLGLWASFCASVGAFGAGVFLSDKVEKV
jgi:hypothetical protein